MHTFYTYIARLACFVGVLSCLLCVSCTSTSVESSASDVTTFINVFPEQSGQVHSVRIFSKLTQVAYVDAKTKAVLTEIDPTSYTYDTTKGLLTILESGQSSTSPVMIHVEGIPVSPAVFVLDRFSADTSFAAVFIDGNQVKEGEDYQFDTRTGVLRFPKSMNIDTVPYYIVWTTEGGVINSCSDNIDGNTVVYDTLVKQWYIDTVIAGSVQ
ncbi:MAG: hypothetical protein K6E51_00450 [Treponema sp.]|nr:hypothetical protein [Treponema sp.]